MEMDPTAPEPMDMFADAKLLELWKKKKQEAFEHRWVLEREWLRNLYYVANRQWIHWDDIQRRWIPKRLTPDVPRPVTNLCRTAVNSLRAAFASIDLGVKSLPVGDKNDNITTAAIADEMAPLIHDEHDMDEVLNELDFWALTCGTCAVQSGWDRDITANKTFVPQFQCMTDGTIVSAETEVCPTDGGTMFEPAKNPDGTPMGEMVGYGRGKTEALSPIRVCCFSWRHPLQGQQLCDSVPVAGKVLLRGKLPGHRTAPNLWQVVV